MSRTMNNLKDSLLSWNQEQQEQQHWKWRFYVTLYVCKVCCLKSHKKPLINLNRLVIYYGRISDIGLLCTDLAITGLVRTVKTSVWYFPLILTSNPNFLLTESAVITGIIRPRSWLCIEKPRSVNERSMSDIFPKWQHANSATNGEYHALLNRTHRNKIR